LVSKNSLGGYRLACVRLKRIPVLGRREKGIGIHYEYYKRSKAKEN